MRGHQEKVENFVANFSKLAPSSRAIKLSSLSLCSLAVRLSSIARQTVRVTAFSFRCTGVTFHRECHGLGRENIGGHLLGVSSVLSCQGKGISRKQLILS